jgi:hypothetical protein
MSYDLLVFDAKTAPNKRDEFLDWYDVRTEWEGEESYDNPANTTPELRAWFMEMIQKYPPMNGPFAPDSFPDDESLVSDYSIGSELIYVAFAWSNAEKAFFDMKALAAKHGVGFFNISSDSSDVWGPDGMGNLRLLPLVSWPQRPWHERCSEVLQLDVGSAGRFGARAIASLATLYGAFLSGSYFIVFSVLSIPIGARNLPGRGMDLMAALAFFLLSLFAFVQCWRKPPFTALSISIAIASILGPIVIRLFVHGSAR